MTTRNALHVRRDESRPRRWPLVLTALICAIAVVAASLIWINQRKQTASQSAQSATNATNKPPSDHRGERQPTDKQSDDQSDTTTNAAKPASGTTPQEKAANAVADMSLEEQVGQLIMAPLTYGSDASTLSGMIADRHVGSVVLIGAWQNGVDGVKASTDVLQGYAPDGNRLIVATDQEGGQVQHLSGAGFDAMPSASAQGQMPTQTLRSNAAGWGRSLAKAGINVDLAPVADTVTVDRASNAPIGALDRDFALDAAGNASHAAAFLDGLRDAGVQGTLKHYPGLGSVTGNTDFTTEGIIDTTTTLDGAEIGAFTTAIGQGKPGMVMMSLATYQAIDPNAPAAFSSTIIDGHLRGTTGYDGVVISDSLSAAAVSGIQPSELGVRFVEAGGDIACIGDPSYVQPIIDGLLARAKSDPDFAKKVAKSATRVMTLKYRMGLAK